MVKRRKGKVLDSILRLAFLFVLLACCSLQASQTKEESAKSLIIGLNHIPGVMEAENQEAPYNKLLNKILQLINLPTKTEYYTVNRSGFLLENARLNCIFPVGAGAYPRKVATAYSEHFNRVTVHLFSFTKPSYSSLEELRDKTIVYQQGYQFGKLVNSNPFNVTFVPVQNQQAAIQLIKTVKAQAYMDYLPDLKLSLSPGDFSQLQFNAEKPILTFYDVFECLESNKQALASFNKAIIQLKNTGELKRLLGEHYNL